jgi:predicted transcriptional regulator
MGKKNFLLLSLEDDKIKKLANIMNNQSCAKILEYLAENEATETQIANDLNFPISTVHYNLKQLLDAKLVDWEKYHYSEKGKEVRHYTVANKYIIIAPKEHKKSLIEQLKKIIPTFLTIILGTAMIYIFTKPLNKTMQFAKSTESTADMAINTATREIPPQTIQNASPTLIQTIIQSPAFYFLLGAIFTLLVILIINKIRKK